METLTNGGIETVLFVRPPNSEWLQRYDHVRAIGIAGNSRAMTPSEMDSHLPESFELLSRRKPRMVHYKICSTFDSSPSIGSIGRAIDIGHGIFRNRLVPLVVGAPALQRFCVFGNLFARSGLDSAPFRLDRHPTMQRHPITPMTEADLRVHLSEQTKRPVELIDVLTLNRGVAAADIQLAEARDGSIVLFDTLTDEHLATIGELISATAERESGPQFLAGSSGMNFALAKFWQTTGVVSPRNQKQIENTAGAVDRTFVVSGSCSPVTERQIAWAADHGFSTVRLDITGLLKSRNPDMNIAELVPSIVRELEKGRSVIAHTCCGPGDQRIAVTRRIVKERHDVARKLGTLLGKILCNVLKVCNLQRVAVTGGDTSGHVARELQIQALEMLGPLAPGSPLCTARGDAEIDGLEMTFKGGQVGHDDFFGLLLKGSSQPRQ